VLVLEIRKTAIEFHDALVKAVAADPRFEWLLDAPLDEVEEQHGKDTPWRVYLVMADYAGARQLVYKFRDYCGSAKSSAAFAGKRKDPAAWFHLFGALSDIRFWGVRDRLITSRTLEHWREDLALQPTRFRFEVELWWRDSVERRQSAIDGLRRLIDVAGGTIVGAPCIISPIHYCGLLAEIPTASIGLVLRSFGDGRDPEAADLPRDVAFLGFDDVMFFRPRAQAIVDPSSDADAGATPRSPRARPQGQPILALLDGMPLENHVHLAERLIVVDPEDIGSRYPASHRRHATAMASLVLHGDLQGQGVVLDRPVVVQPVMRSRTLPDGTGEEAMPDDRLALDAFHMAVRQIVTSTETSTVKVINVSLGDRTRMFDGPGPSPWARLIDYLAHEHRLLFIVSAGNCDRNLELEGDPKDAHDCFRSNPEQFSRRLLRAMYREAAQRKLLSPGESVNALTIGALHDDEGESMPPRGQVFDPFLRPGFLSPVTSFGMGVRRSVKPDLVVAGGRQALREPPSWTMHAQARVQLVGQANPIGHRVAAPGMIGSLDGVAMSRGTSNAAALTSRAAVELHGVIEELRSRYPDTDLPSELDAVLLKALLTHGASWPRESEIWRSIVALPSPRDRDEAARAYGYGVPDFRRAAACTETRATAIGVGTLADEHAWRFRFPRPACLDAQTTLRRLVVTMAYLTPIHPGHQAYRRARVWVDHAAAATALGLESRDVTVTTARRGTLEHVVLEGKGRAPNPTVTELELTVGCRADAGELEATVPFALVVTLEIGEGQTLPIYAQVAERLRVRQRGRA
jgi:hypothetical protein